MLFHVLDFQNKFLDSIIIYCFPNLFVFLFVYINMTMTMDANSQLNVCERTTTSVSI